VKLPPTALSCAEMINAMKKDKKRTGEKFPLILMNNKFEFDRVNDLIEEEINETLDELGKLLN
jgi:3-dehydroquinate synthetase